MNFAKFFLLSKAIKALCLDLVRFLVIDCDVEIYQTDIELFDWSYGLDIREKE